MKKIKPPFLKFFSILGIFLVLFSCKKKEDNTIVKIKSADILSIDDSIPYQESFRPQFHFAPEKNWMNDPNGMVFYKGVYHLFYQYYPKDIIWGPMHWGHVTSTDLIHWTNKKIALFPDKLGYIFSGSAVVDFENTSGLGSKENPPMIAIFTYHNPDGEKAGRTDYQTQGLAYSIDEGETWEKYDGNPIIANPNRKDFRDPKVFWNEETKLWNLVLVAGDHAQFYSSTNLIKWELNGEFGKKTGAHGGVWECPDLFKLKVGESGEEKWVLFISINPGAPKGGSGTQYFIGDYNGKTFKTVQKEAKWVDFGTDNYAGVTFNNAPDNKRIFIGWMSNWQYATLTPTKKWRSAMTLPRSLSLEKINNNYVLKSTVVPELKKALSLKYYKKNISLTSDIKAKFEYEFLNQSAIKFKSEAKNLKLVFSNAVNDSLVLDYDAQKKLFSIDRTHSGLVNFEEHFGKEIHHTEVPNLGTNSIEYHIILDWSSVEIFLNDGIYSFTEQLFPKKPYTKLSIKSDANCEIKNLTINKINSIWQKPKAHQ